MSRRILTWAASLVAVAVVVVLVVSMVMRPGDRGEATDDPFQRLAEEQAALAPDQRPQIEVLNGCGVSGIAARAQDYLREKGYDVVNVENARDFRYRRTLVIDRGGDVRIARALARDLGTSNLIRQVRPDLVLQATVILGEDYRELEPYRGDAPDG
jgi:hypothetical protein